MPSPVCALTEIYRVVRLDSIHSNWISSRFCYRLGDVCACVLFSSSDPAGCTDPRISALARKVAPLFAKFGGAGGANPGAGGPQQQAGGNPTFDDEVD